MSVDKLFERVLDLEARFGLEAAGKAYSDRLLDVLDAFDAAVEEGEKAEAEADALGAQLAKLQDMVGDAEPEAAPEAGSVEAALANIEAALGTADQDGGKDDFESFREKVRGTNINENTLLATDYLNHFNEIVMTLEMVPMMPEILEEAKEWKPKSYQQHFADSTFSDKDLAVEAYDHVPDQFRRPFETTIEQMDQLVAHTIEKLESQLVDAPPEQIQETASSNSKMIQRLIDVASGIIHGSEVTMDQGDIDSFLL